jgi:hypothetical protein
VILLRERERLELCTQALEYVSCDLYMVFHRCYCRTNKITSGDPFIVNSIVFYTFNLLLYALSVPECSAVMPLVFGAVYVQRSL